MAIWKKIVIFVIALATIIFMLYIFSLSSNVRSQRVCESISFDVSDDDLFQFVSEKDLNFQLQNAGVYPVGKSIGDINLPEMESKLEELNMVKRAVCCFTVDGNIAVAVTQRVPKFRVKSLNEDYYIDNERKRMPISLKFTAHVPVVTGCVNFEFASTELYDFIIFVEESSQWSSAFTQIYVYPNNKIDLVPRVGDFIIELGFVDRYEKKLEKLQEFYDDVPNYCGWDTYSKINLDYKDQVVCTKK